MICKTETLTKRLLLAFCRKQIEKNVCLPNFRVLNTFIMKQLLLFIVLSTVLTKSSCYAQAAVNDFRGFNWGSSFEQVLGGETSRFLFKENDDLLEYQDQLAGMDCNVSYSFNNNNKLVSANYSFTKRYINPQLYIEDYNTFKNLLIQKYGIPSAESQTWTAVVPESERNNPAQAIADGNLKLISSWATERSNIQIVLSGNSRGPILHIHYTCKSLDELQDKTMIQTALKKL